MRLFKSVTFILLVCLSVSAFAQKKKKGKKEETPVVAEIKPVFSLKNQIDSVSYGMGVSLAQNLKNQGLDTVNAEAFAKGVADYFKQTNIMTPEQANPFLQAYFTGIYQKKVEASKAVGQKFLDENKTKPDVITLPSGLQYQVIAQGTGPKPKPEDRVKAHYQGTFIDGKVFDSSIQRGEPVVFGVTEVIPGWTEALQLMSVGSKWKLFIPYDLAYGERGSGQQIPPYSALLFDVELIGIETPPTPPVEENKTPVIQKKTNTTTQKKK